MHVLEALFGTYIVLCAVLRPFIPLSSNFDEVGPKGHSPTKTVPILRDVFSTTTAFLPVAVAFPSPMASSSPDSGFPSPSPISFSTAIDMQPTPFVVVHRPVGVEAPTISPPSKQGFYSSFFSFSHVGHIAARMHTTVQDLCTTIYKKLWLLPSLIPHPPTFQPSGHPIFIGITASPPLSSSVAIINAIDVVHQAINTSHATSFPASSYVENVNVVPTIQLTSGPSSIRLGLSTCPAIIPITSKSPVADDKKNPTIRVQRLSISHRKSIQDAFPHRSFQCPPPSLAEAQAAVLMVPTTLLLFLYLEVIQPFWAKHKKQCMRAAAQVALVL
ncbi:hypothetical protein OF83DRAFT_652856 [Amylostereum chailletii]|nr:hypothetical protein OF83DRAFT_652856 [Amylostereum chailletii]